MAYNICQFSSVTQSCPPLCDPMDCSTPGQIRIILEEFNKGTIYKSVVRVREIPSRVCLGLVTVEFLCYQTEGGVGAGDVSVKKAV